MNVTPRFIALAVVCLAACGRAAAPDEQQAAARPSRPLKSRFADSAMSAALARPSAKLEYRWVVAESLGGAQPPKSIFDPATHRWLTLSDTVVLTLSDIDSVRVLFSHGVGSVITRPTPAASDRFLVTTARHVGQRLGILLNGQLLVAPSIGSPWSGQIPVGVGLDSALAVQLRERLAAGLAKRPGTPTRP
jgi:preprotein translocase subunit SecD